MNLQAIQELVYIMEHSQLSVLEVQEGELRVRMERARSFSDGASSNITLPIARDTVPAAPIAAPNVPEETDIGDTGDAGEIPQQYKGNKEIRSPMVGTFHPLPDGSVGLGSFVKKGQPVCLIEAMKLMNEIVMEADGEILWVAVEPGTTVEYGQLLMLYK